MSWPRSAVRSLLDTYADPVAQAEVERLRARVAELEARERRVWVEIPLCENYTATDCNRAGRDINSPYTAEAYCLPCRLIAALDGPEARS